MLEHSLVDQSILRLRMLGMKFLSAIAWWQRQASNTRELALWRGISRLRFSCVAKQRRREPKPAHWAAFEDKIQPS